MKNKEVTKQVVGIDIGKDKFYVCYKIKYSDFSVTIKGTSSFTNDYQGFTSFLDWCSKRDKNDDSLKLIFVMEATGVYYEELAYFLYEKEKQVSVQLAKKLKYFAKGCNLKTKTDKVDAAMIADFGIEKNLTGTDLWEPPSNQFKMIRDLTREHTSLKNSQTAAKLQLHAMEYSARYEPMVLELKKEQILFLSKQIELVEKALRKKVSEDEIIANKIKRIEEIQGLGFMTIVKVITEVNGFILFKNIRQLVSYAGLDVVENQSGSHKGKTKISKNGNARLRAALYMPALTSTKHNKTLKSFYERINENRAIKMQGVVAVMRKLLILIYTIWTKDVDYIDNYQGVK